MNNLNKLSSIIIDGRIFWLIRAFFYKFRFLKVGTLSYLGRPIFLSNPKKMSIGNRVGIFPGMRAEVCDDGGSICIEDNVTIAQNLHIVAASNIIIKSGTVISANVLITDLDNDLKFISSRHTDRPRIIKETKIGRNCFLGFGCVILPGSVLEDGCSVGANSVVKGHHKKGSVIVGSPAKVIKVYEEDVL